jgi:hypothetical protein
MKLTQLVKEKCNQALNESMGIIALDGMPLTAPSRIRTIVSNFAKDYRVRLSCTHDRANHLFMICKKEYKPPKEYRPLVEIPVCLFKFINGNEITFDQMQEIKKFQILLTDLVNGAENTKYNEDEIIPEFDFSNDGLI